MYKEIILCLALCGLTAAELSDSEIVGRTYEINYVPTATAFPFAVYIYTNTRTSQHFGAGTIITANSILCTAGQLEFAISYEIGYGSHLRSKQTNQILLRRNVILHPQYDTTTMHHNIAIIRLREDIAFDLNTQPIRLARRSNAVVDYFAEQQGTMIGWGGYLADSLTLSNNLKYIGVLGMTNDVCATRFGEVSFSMCTYGFNNIESETCVGERGGPLIIQENNVWTQIGVISFGNSCPSTIPTGYISVAFYLDWISRITGVIVRD